VDGPEGYNAKWNQTVTEGQLLMIHSDVWLSQVVKVIEAEKVRVVYRV
jgi:hypothetical protein